MGIRDEEEIYIATNHSKSVKHFNARAEGRAYLIKSELQLHHEKRPRFVINRFITDRCRGDAGWAEAEVAER